MKYLPLLVAVVAVSACSQMPAGVQSVGQSQQPAPTVAQCIAKQWADASQTQVISQTTVANNVAMDVYAPGQQPPSGTAAVVRPSGTGSWVGLRSGSAGGAQGTGSISTCL
jgi:hypothetical protein